MVVVTHQAEKFGLMTVRPTVQGTTFNMRGQVCRGHTNATAFVQQSGGQCTGLRVGRPGF